jgi:hypothetical protein
MKRPEETAEIAKIAEQKYLFDLSELGALRGSILS